VIKAGYNIEGNKIVYKSIGDGAALVELNGIRRNTEPTVEKNKIILSSNNFAAEEISVVSNENYYEFELAKSDYDVDSKFTGSAEKDIITNNGDEMIIEGGAANDRILNNGTNNTIYGGKGNDTLIGGDGDDTFIFRAGDGTDTIKDFETSIDNLLIYDKRGLKQTTFKGKYNSKNEILTLAVTGGGKIILENISADSNLMINGVAHNIDGKKLK